MGKIKNPLPPYTFDGIFHFADGVTYDMPEALHIAASGATPSQMHAIHIVKKVFDGYLINPSDNPERVRTMEKSLLLKKVCPCGCGSRRRTLRRKGPHIGMYCHPCETWITWISPSVSHEMVIEHPTIFQWGREADRDFAAEKKVKKQMASSPVLPAWRGEQMDLFTSR